MKTDPFIHFDEGELFDELEEALESVAEDLRSTHGWHNRTGDLERSIRVERDGEGVRIVLDVPYASFVDAKAPYLEELQEEGEDKGERAVERWWEDINR